MNVKHPRNPRLILHQRYQRLRSAQRPFCNHLWDLHITAISMLIKRAMLFFVLSPFIFITRFFLEDIEWQIN